MKYKTLYLEIIEQSKKRKRDDIIESTESRFITETVPSDGNCFFHSVAYFFPEYTHSELRHMAVEYLRENKDDFIHFFRSEKEYYSYIDKMNRDGEWATDKIIASMAYTLNTNIIIYAKDYDQNFNPDAPTSISILHINENHFEPIIGKK